MTQALTGSPSFSSSSSSSSFSSCFVGVTQLRSILTQFRVDQFRFRRSASPYIRRFKVCVGDVSILDWIANQSVDVTTGYWRARDVSFESAGLGRLLEKTADSISDLQTCIDYIRPFLSQDVRAYHVIQFGSESPQNIVDSPDSPYPFCYFYVPLIELIRDRTGTYLCANIMVDDQLEATIESALSILSLIVFESKSVVLPRLVEAITYSPDADEWNEMVLNAQSLMHERMDEKTDENRLSKVVLARRASARFDADLTGYQLLTLISQEFNNCYAFGFSIGDAQFIGASPERLFLKQGHQLFSEAIAGTRPRGDCESEDAAFEQALLNSAKDRYEHEIVLEMIRSHFINWCEDYSEASRCVLKLSNVQHLLVGHSGTLMTDKTEADLYTTLHPTPAISGAPCEPAVQFIESNEPFDRLYYCGTVGWISKDAAEFVVSIRSSLVTPSHTYVYAGAGIVNSSDYTKEWDELNHKSALYLSKFKPNY